MYSSVGPKSCEPLQPPPAHPPGFPPPWIWGGGTPVPLTLRLYSGAEWQCSASAQALLCL